MRSDQQLDESASFHINHRPEPEFAFQVYAAGGKLIVALRYDGTITFGEGITPTEAADEFWKHIGSHIVASRGR